MFYATNHNARTHDSLDTIKLDTDYPTLKIELSAPGWATDFAGERSVLVAKRLHGGRIRQSARGGDGCREIARAAGQRV